LAGAGGFARGGEAGYDDELGWGVGWLVFWSGVGWGGVTAYWHGRYEATSLAGFLEGGGLGSWSLVWGRIMAGCQ
jgi:hypothetical protein